MFPDRLSAILAHYSLSAKEFADQMQVQRSSISHLINGRNKPSFDFIAKLSATFPELSNEWILHGKGTMIEPDTNVTESEITEAKERATIVGDSESQKAYVSPSKREKEIKRIIVFYGDGSFEEFNPTKS